MDDGIECKPVKDFQLNADARVGEEYIQISAASDSAGWLLLMSILI